MARALPLSFYRRPTIEVAHDLLGRTLWHKTHNGISSGRIVEVEAYLGLDDPASHAFRGPTPRSAIMFGDSGVAYVYFSYGVHHCMNVVAHPAGVPGAVLIRALEPVSGIELMRQRRHKDSLTQLCSGPGKLCQAMAITLPQNGSNLQKSALRVLDEGHAPKHIVASPRIGISQAREELLRFYDAGNPHVSAGPRASPTLK